jgi:ABC-type dipeptide/oligopeptide/nickel transport system permease component
MTRFLLQRVIGGVPIIVVISFLIFAMLHLAPGDPATLLAPSEATAAQIAEVKLRWGLDQPFYVQYFYFLSQAIHGDLGNSFRFSRPVAALIGDRLPATIELAFVAILISMVIAIPIGLFAGARPNSKLDNFGSVFGLFGISMPNFWFAIMLILVFAGILHILPSSGRSTYGVLDKSITSSYLLDSILQGSWAGLVDWFKHIILPAIALGTAFAGLLMRITRSAVMDVMREDYVMVARAKGLRSRTVLRRHVLRGSLIPIVTVIGLEIGSLLGGAIVVETVFAWPGIGSLLVAGVAARDYPLVTGIVLVYSLGFVLINLVVDTAYAMVDPRIRY